MIKNIIITMLSIGAIAGLLVIVNNGLIAIEIVECIKWQEQAQVYPDYYLTNWQIAQCQTVAPETLN